MKTIDHWNEWKDEQIRLARKWWMYERLVEATDFEEYLAGDLPKPPHDDSQLTDSRELVNNGTSRYGGDYSMQRL